MSELILKEIDKVYKIRKKESVHALDHVSLSLDNGLYGLTGENGAGKSTLIRILAGITEPDSGEFFLDGRPVIPQSSEYKKGIGYMPQQDQLFSWRSIRSNVNLGLEIQKKGPAFYERAEELMKKYGVLDVASMTPDQLSGGMRQRCALIRTLVTDPEFLLLDESFSALDYQTRIAVSIDTRSIIKREHKTALLVTHDISESLMLSDRIIVMTKSPGRIHTIHDLSSLKDMPPEQRLEQTEYQLLLKEIWKELGIHG